MKKFNPLIETLHDGLVTSDVGVWSEQKYKLMGLYADIFTRSMREKWHKLIYIDIYSGSGFAKIKGNEKIVYGSPMIALSLPIQFDKYIFCDVNNDNIQALEARVKKLFPDKDAIFIAGDCNEKINDIIEYIPRHSKSNKVLSFCFVDPFSLNLRFETIRKLSFNKAIDFLILLALHMDANRNYKTYSNDENLKIDMFLDNNSWRGEFSNSKIDDNEKFVQFLARKYNENMKALGYLETKYAGIRYDERNLPLYHLGFFSRNDLGLRFWNEVNKYGKSQTELDL